MPNSTKKSQIRQRGRGKIVCQKSMTYNFALSILTIDNKNMDWYNIFRKKVSKKKIYYFLFMKFYQVMKGLDFI